jgi:hypothetical protein
MKMRYGGRFASLLLLIEMWGNSQRAPTTGLFRGLIDGILTSNYYENLIRLVRRPGLEPGTC